MAKTAKQTYDNQSISALKGADRVRKRPGVIFGSDGLEGCEHAVFEILSNAIDEAREGHGDLIIVTRYEDQSIEVEDFGRGCPVDWNEAEGRYNWELTIIWIMSGNTTINSSSSTRPISDSSRSPELPEYTSGSHFSAGLPPSPAAHRKSPAAFLDGEGIFALY